jgi:hypothetical protein
MITGPLSPETMPAELIMLELRAWPVSEPAIAVSDRLSGTGVSVNR